MAHIVIISDDDDDKEENATRREPQVAFSRDYLEYILLGILVGTVVIAVIVAAVYTSRKIKKDKRVLSSYSDNAATVEEEGDFTDIRPQEMRSSESIDLPTAITNVHSAELGDTTDMEHGT